MTAVPAAPSGLRRGRRLGRTVLIAAVLVVLAGVVASRITLNYFVLSPGDARPVGPLIMVPAGLAHRGHGQVLFTDVFVAPVTLLGYVPDRLSSNTEIVPTVELTGGPAIPASELTAQGYLEMAQAKAAAMTAALRRLGYAVPEHDAGAVVEAVSTGTPADRALKVGQVITAVDGTRTENVCAFVGALAAHAPGERVTLRVVANRFSASGSALAGPVVHTTVRLGTRPAGVPAERDCPGVRAGQAFLGISTGTQQDFSFPFRITINTAGVGGPSAGLAMTLGLLNTLSGGNLTGGHTVAATGTIDPSGRVGDVGGVALKTVAVERAGASVFFVPGPELSAARSKATPALRVYAVNTLAEALSELQRLGGHVPGSARIP